MKKIDTARYKKRLLTSVVIALICGFVTLLNNYYFLPENERGAFLSRLPVMIIFIIVFMAAFWYLIGIREAE